VPIRIVPYAREHENRVRQLNTRLEAAGSPMRFSESHVPAWLPKAPGRSIYQECFLALDEHSAARGGYVLKRQEFRVAGKTVSIGNLQYPLSEGIVDPKYRAIGGMLLLDLRARQPRFFGLGGGGLDQPALRMLQAARCDLSPVPFFLKVIRPFRFLRKIAFLRPSAARRGLLDALAFTGLGWLAIKGLQASRSRNPSPRALVVETPDEFSDWADELWEKRKDQYGFIAVRDSRVLRILYPGENERFIRLKVSEGGRVIGWAVLLDTQMSAHRQFGDLRVGSIVDGMASTEDAMTIVRSATDFLQRRRVDLIVSNQRHAAWCAALKRAGFLPGPSNFIFSPSKELSRLLESSGVGRSQIHLTRGDGDGPINL
jgi:hypothetical protein